MDLYERTLHGLLASLDSVGSTTSRFVHSVLTFLKRPHDPQDENV